MKKLLALLMACVALISCEGPMGPQGPMGEPGEGTYWFNQDFIVEPTGWTVSTDENGMNTLFYCEVEFNELTTDIFKDGLVSGYLIQENGTATPLPSTFYYEEKIDDENIERWSEHYTFECKPGWITFFVQYDDFKAIEPGEKTFRIVLMY